MANVPVCALPTLSVPRSGGDVYLLAVDSISDLHSTPLDTETPHEEDVTSDARGEKSMSGPPDKSETPSAEHPTARRCGSPCTNALLTFLIVMALITMSLLIYNMHLYRNQDSVLRALAETFDRQIDSLQQLSVNDELKRHESR